MDNYILKLYPTNTKINNQSLIYGNVKSFNNDMFLVIWIAIIIGLCYIFLKKVNKDNKCCRYYSNNYSLLRV